MSAPAILLVMPYLKEGGAETTLSGLCGQLKSRGFRIFVVVTAPSRNSPGDTTHWFTPAVEGVYHLPRLIDVGEWRGFIFRLLHQSNIGVLWLAGSSFVYELLPEIRRLFPGIAIVDLLFNPSGHAEAYFKQRARIDRVVVEHEGMKQWLIRRGERESRISIISNGIDLDKFQPQPRQDWRTNQQRPSGPPYVIGFFARLSPEKGPDIYIKIAERFRHRKDVEFLLCGSGPLEAALRTQCRDADLNGKVHFLGFVPSVKILPCCDITVISSRLDGRPHILMESLAMGVPVVASRTGAIPAMAPEGRGTRLCQAADIDSFQDAIEQLLVSPDARRELASAGVDQARTHFSAAPAGESYATLFTGLARDCGIRARPFSPQALQAASDVPLDLDQSRFIGTVRTLLTYWRLRRNPKAMAELSALFDAGHYTAACRNAAASRISPLWHYLLFGFRRGCDPSPRFHTRYYLTVYPKVARAGINPLLHYVAEGRRQGRACLPDYALPEEPLQTAAV